MKRHYARKAGCHEKFQAKITKSIMAVFNDEIPIAPQLMHSSEDLQSDDGPQPGEIDIPMAGDDFIPRRRCSNSLTTEEDSSGQ